jgi:hypothetical protein
MASKKQIAAARRVGQLPGKGKTPLNVGSRALPGAEVPLGEGGAPTQRQVSRSNAAQSAANHAATPSKLFRPLVTPKESAFLSPFQKSRPQISLRRQEF